MSVTALCATAQTPADTLTTASGETGSHWGLDLGLELAIPSGSHGQWHTGSGAVLTGHYTLPLGARWYLEPALAVYYNTLGNDYMYSDGYIYDGTVKNVGLRVPLTVGYRLDVSETFTLDLATGPWLNVNVFARQYGMPDTGAEEPVPHSVNLFRHGFRYAELLWGLRLSATFSEHYVVGFSAGIGLTPMAKSVIQDHTRHIRRNTVALLLGYKF